MNLSQRIALYTRHVREFLDKQVHNQFDSVDSYNKERDKLLIEKKSLTIDCRKIQKI